MKRICLWLALLVLLTGCGKAPTAPTTPTPSPTVTTATTASHPITLDIYAVNDLHGKLVDTSAQPGVDELSTYLQHAQQTGNTILLATGDMWQGAAESNLTGGCIVTEWMNELDFAAMTMGGHEYDWGEEQIARNRELATFPFLAINIYSRETQQQVEYCQSSVVLDIEGIQVGIIGAIGNCYYSIASENTTDVYFKTGYELTALVKAESQRLRGNGVDFIVYAIHDGYDGNAFLSPTTPISDQELENYYDVTLSNGYVDLVFEADSHYTYTTIDRYGVYHLQAGGNNSGISHATVQIDPSAEDAVVIQAESIPSSQYGSGEDHPVVEELLEKYSDSIAPSTVVVGTNDQYRGKSDICQLVADLYCSKGVETWGEQYDIVLGGGYMSCRSPGYLPAGEVSYSQLLSLLPFDNQIMLCSIRGQDLINRFLETDHYAYYIKTTAYGDSIRDSIDPNATYYVVTDSYSAYYSYNRMTVIETYADGVFARDLVADYITKGGWNN